MDLSKTIVSAFGAAASFAPGATLSCTWKRVTDSVYDPLAGASLSITAVETFTALRSSYNVHHLQNGIQAGDVPLFVDAASISCQPPIGAVLSWDGKEWEILSVKDFAGVLYEFQMREIG